VGHDRLGPAAEQAQQVVDQFTAGCVAGDAGFENMGVADLPGAAERFFPFEAIDCGLDSGIGGSMTLGKGLLNFTNGQGSEGIRIYYTRL